MKINVRFFAALREAVGQESMELPCREPVSLADLMERMSTRMSVEAFTALNAPNVRVAVNQQLINGNNLQIQPGDELAFLPPVSGG